MATRATVNFTTRFDPAVREALRRLTVVTGCSQPQLLESLILNLEEVWLNRFDEAERKRYDNLLMSAVEAREIRRRAMAAGKPAEPPSEQAA
jgi:hypothetical protein